MLVSLKPPAGDVALNILPAVITEVLQAADRAADGIRSSDGGRVKSLLTPPACFIDDPIFSVN